MAHPITRLPIPLSFALAKLRQALTHSAKHQITRHWDAYSRLFLVSEGTTWSISWDMRELGAIARQLGVRSPDLRWLPSAQQQVVFYGSRFILTHPECLQPSHRIGLAYFHGRPGSGVQEFDTVYTQLCHTHERIARIQVSHSEMHEVVLGSGIVPEKVFRIPIGINLSFFALQTTESRRRVRAHYGIPESAVVVGSFQKDGNGWGEGMEPKLIKGPDVFLQAIEHLKTRIPELFVFLSGPARGYVKAGLERLGVPYQHCLLKHYPDIGKLYQAIDVYIVASRQEGGPKAILESMASGVPLVTTRVGQAMDLVRHEENGWMVEVEDAEGLAYWAEYIINHRDGLESVLRRARQTAEENSYRAQLPLWRNFLNGFVERRG